MHKKSPRNLTGTENTGMGMKEGAFFDNCNLSNYFVFRF